MKPTRLPIIRLAAGGAAAMRRLGGDRHACYQAIIRLLTPGPDAACRYLAGRAPFLITSTGRTGTRWLATLLNLAPGACVAHEPVPNEHRTHAGLLTDPESPHRYLYTFRLRDMAQRCREADARIYGEVNSVLRFHLAALRQLLPTIRIIHLVRDGRDVVRSIINRQQTRAWDNPLHRLTPPPVDAYARRWHALTPLERTCWGWQFENALIASQADATVRIEDINASHTCLQTQILDPLGLTLQPADWVAHARQPQNSTRTWQVAAWEQWPESDRRVFRTICTAAMQRYGYWPHTPAATAPET